MINSTHSLLLPLVLTGLATGLGAQIEASTKKPDPAIKAKIKEFDKATKDRKGAKDGLAQNIVDQFLQGYETMHPKDQAAVRKAMESVLTSPRIKRKPEQAGLFNAASIALGRMGPEASKGLVKAYGSTKFKKEEWIAVRAVIIKSVGRTKDPRQIKFLLDEASRAHEDKILQTAGQALGHFEDADLKTRKPIAKQLIKKFNEIDGQSRASLDPNDPNVKRAKERLAAIRRDWNETLRKLTRQSLSAPSDWNRFYNKNKTKNWDKLKGGD